jgi:putative component of membrane protein insertase Oxa1/YidC/SpoIIIJ protein YidD
MYYALIQLVLFTNASLEASLIDANFKLSKQITTRQNVKNNLAEAYTTIFKQFLYSRCRWLPSDSDYLKIASRHCGVFKGTLFAIARFTNEYDAFLINSDIVNDHQHLRFVDFKFNCQ